MNTTQQGILRRVFTSDSFIEKVAFLCTTAIVSGLVIPLIIAEVQSLKARNEAIFSAQTKLLEDFSTLVFEYETLAIEVAWYGTSKSRDAKMQQAAYERYSQRTSNLFSKWRTLTGHADVLASREIGDEMQRLLEEVVFKLQHNPLIRMYNDRETEEAAWEKQNDINQEKLESMRAFISELAKEMKLTKSHIYEGLIN